MGEETGFVLIVLTGEQSPGAAINVRLRALGWGRVFIHRLPVPWAGEAWALDSGVYGDWLAGRAWDADDFQRRVERAHAVGRPYMAVTPDLVGDAASLDFSLGWLKRLPDWPWFLVLQDGMTVDDVRPVIGLFKGLFLGGTNRFKTTAPIWAKLAREHGIPFHYGRAGTPGKLATAREVGAQSCDSSFPLWTVARFNYFVREWLESPQPRFEFGEAP